MSVLEVKNLRKRFGDVQVLKGIDLKLERGEVLSIIGSSGGGKTTLLRCLNFLETADNGTISVDGKIIFDGSSAKKLSDKEIRENRLHFGMVFQSFNLFPQYNVLKNVMLAPLLHKKQSEEEIRENALKLIERVGLSEKIDSYPCQLSGGQQQRVAIARALVNNPDIILADEPTGALDTHTSVQVMELLKTVSKDRLVVMVTHNPELAEETDRIMVSFLVSRFNRGRFFGIIRTCRHSSMGL